MLVSVFLISHIKKIHISLNYFCRIIFRLFSYNTFFHPLMEKSIERRKKNRKNRLLGFNFVFLNERTIKLKMRKNTKL